MPLPIRKASRSGTKLKIGLNGVSGSGKTYSALLLAKGILGSLSKVVVIDTEETGDLEEDTKDYSKKKRGSDFYSDLGDFSVLPMSAPFSPDKFVSAIKLCVSEGFECIIIDSATHEWEGPGGVLDIHNDYGGRFQDWAKTNKQHQKFVNEVMKCPVHLILTMRQKSDHAMIQDGPKMQIKKVGLKIQQREGFEYDLHLTFSIEHETHLCTIGKDRTGLFSDRPPFLITEDLGKELRDWADVSQD